MGLLSKKKPVAALLPVAVPGPAQPKPASNRDNALPVPTMTAGVDYYTHQSSLLPSPPRSPVLSQGSYLAQAPPAAPPSAYTSFSGSSAGAGHDLLVNDQLANLHSSQHSSVGESSDHFDQSDVRGAIKPISREVAGGQGRTYSVEMTDGTLPPPPPPPSTALPTPTQSPPANILPPIQSAPQLQANTVPHTVSPIDRLPPNPAIATSAALPPTPLPAAPAVPRKTSSRYNLADFNFLRTLGTGSFGRVHLVRSLHNSRSYAVKVLSKERVVKMKQVEHTNSEREMLERVRHPFLVNLWGTFQCQRNLYMVMDFVAGGELFSLLRKSQRFPDPVAKFFAAEVALALDYLHSLDIIYRDLKPENILLGADGHVKITDFGFAKYVPDITWTLCGTPDYLAPEIVQSRGYNKSVDWYALGVLMFEMLAGYPPFFTEDTNPMRLYEKIILNKVRYPSYFTPAAISLLRSLLTADLSKRYGNLARGSTDVFSHEWFQEVDWETLYRKEIPAPYVPKIEGEWDSSNFDKYAEIDVAEYGRPGPDDHIALFTAF